MSGLSGHVDDDLAVVEIHRIGPQRRGAGRRASGVEFESVHVERAQDDPVINLPVCKRSALVRADRGKGAQAAVPPAEHRDLVTTDGKGPALTVGNLIDWAERVRSPDRWNGASGWWS